MEQLFDFERSRAQFRGQFKPIKILSRAERVNRKQQAFDRALAISLLERIEGFEVGLPSPIELEEQQDCLVSDIRHEDAERLKRSLMK